MTKKNNYYMVLISLMVLIASSNFALKAKADPPQSIILNYSLGTLNVLIGHAVGDPDEHYIDLVRINVNGSEVLSTPFTNQSSTDGASYHFSITANDGATIEVYARCNEGGSMTACMVVGGGSCEQNGGSGIPGYFGLWLIIGFSVIVAITVMYKKIRR